MLAPQPGSVYLLSAHARDMIDRRGICPMAVADALGGRRIVTGHDYVLYYNNSDRVVVVVDPRERVIVTCYVATRHDVKRELSR